MRVWYEALSVISEFKAPAYWRMANGAEFWWTVNPSELGQDGFTRQPFTYAEIVSVTVFDVLSFGRDRWTCDWSALRNRLIAIEGLLGEALQDVRNPLALPPNNALRLTAAT